MSSDEPSSSVRAPIIAPIPLSNRDKRPSNPNLISASAPHSGSPAVSTFVPERAAATPGTTLLPGKFMFWVHNDEKVKEAEANFSSAEFFRAHTDGTLSPEFFIPLSSS